MYTIVETPQFIHQVDDIWTDDERLDFFGYLANNPLKGDVTLHSADYAKFAILPKDTVNVGVFG